MTSEQASHPPLLPSQWALDNRNHHTPFNAFVPMRAPPEPRLFLFRTLADRSQLNFIFLGRMGEKGAELLLVKTLVVGFLR